MEDKIIERENKIINNMGKLFSEWTELKIKLLCREERIKQMKRDLNVISICLGGIIICLVIILIIGVE
tara:strand:+ start:1782 stop:1985 length:204 start_codon:yes stop_codon:yes gene_type:complete